jgi:hypothetical protein
MMESPTTVIVNGFGCCGCVAAVAGFDDGVGSSPAPKAGTPKPIMTARSCLHIDHLARAM